MKIRKVSTGDTCEYKGCSEDAECLVYSRKKEKVMKVCAYHAELVLDEGCPEYTEVCANCGCENPIN